MSLDQGVEHRSGPFTLEKIDLPVILFWGAFSYMWHVLQGTYVFKRLCRVLDTI